MVLLASPFARLSLYWPTVQALVEREYRVVAVEMPGCGCGARLNMAWRFEDYARWVAGFLAAMELEDVVLIGHSHTGAVAMSLAALHPERLKSAVIVDCVGAAGPRSILAVLIGCAMCIPFEVRFVLRGTPRLAYNLARHGRNFLVQFWRAVRADVRPDASEVTLPVLLAWGAHDFVMPRAGARELQSLLREHEFYLSQRGSHDWLIERADEFAAAVHEFSARRPGIKATISTDES